MRLAGFLLMPAGGIIVLAALSMLPPGAAREAFVLAGVAIQGFGLGVAIRSHLPRPEEKE
ncbi:MAG: hypothetical protein JST11_18100 [Acidobacteria bacterium]|nr:hypothetical protein [Acidobacteriota bacterium]